MNTALQIARLVAVLALIGVAAAIATPKGRLPLALRGLAKMVNAVPSSSRRQALAGHTANTLNILFAQVFAASN